MPHDWLSAYVHFQGSLYSGATDRVILDVVEPFVRTCQRRDWISQFFFIRYSENGPHVRFRLRGEEDVLRDTVKPELRAHVRDALPPDLHPGEREEGPDAPIRWVPYERETNRYGGPRGVKLAEQFFHCSSEAALRLLEGCRGQGRSARLGKGLLSMVVLLHAFFDTQEKAVDLLEQYGTGYLNSIARDEEQQSRLQEAFKEGYDRQDDTLTAYVNETWARLEEGAPLTDVLDDYYDGLRDVARQFEDLFEDRHLVRNDVVPDSWREATGMIVPSYLHMMNNRLGIPIPEEAYLAHLIEKTFVSTEPTPAQA